MEKRLINIHQTRRICKVLDLDYSPPINDISADCVLQASPWSSETMASITFLSGFPSFR